MILTNKQEEALKIAVARYKAGEPWTCISGYAGTGKSTLVNFIIAALGLNPSDEVAYVTFTGKAATVLQNKGCPNATTAHRLLYYSKLLPNGKFIFTPRPRLENKFLKLIVVDEISMLPVQLWELLLSHKIHVIACGDPFQLPPINKDTDNHVLDKPHVFLDQIMRQAAESEIIRISMDIREGNPLSYFQGQEVRIIPEHEIVDGIYTWADQIICATNKTRLDINNFMRAAAKRGPEPEVGDKIICCRNDWDTTDINLGNSLVNGTIGIISDLQFDEIKYPIPTMPSVPSIVCNLSTSANEEFNKLIIDKKALTTGEKTLTPQQEYRLKEFIKPLEFNYGYAITCHRAQGSQWDKVLVVEEKFPFAKEEHARWLYTAVTRAADKLILVR